MQRETKAIWQQESLKYHIFCYLLCISNQSKTWWLKTKNLLFIWWVGWELSLVRKPGIVDSLSLPLFPPLSFLVNLVFHLSHPGDMAVSEECSKKASPQTRPLIEPLLAYVCWCPTGQSKSHGQEVRNRWWEQGTAWPPRGAIPRETLLILVKHMFKNNHGRRWKTIFWRKLMKINMKGKIRCYGKRVSKREGEQCQLPQNKQARNETCSFNLVLLTSSVSSVEGRS